MNGIKSVAKVVAATAAAGALLTATVAGAAFAADFGSFPAPFVKDGKFDGKVVVGANAQTADVVGAIGVAAALGQAAWMEGTATGTGKATVSVASADGVSGEVLLGQAVYDATDFSGKLSLKNSRFAALKKWTGSDLKYKDTTTELAAHQEINVSTGVKVDHGETDAAAGKWYLKVPSSALTVKMVFDDAFNESKGDVVFDMFGKELTLEGVGSGSITVSSGSKYSVSLDNPTFTDSVSGATITFKGADTNGAKAYVTVTNAGVTDTAVLDADVEKTVAGVALKATDIFRMSDTSMFASVTVGSKLSDDISEGEKFLSEANWEMYDVVDANSATTLTSFTVAYAPSSTLYLAPGEKLSGLFNGFDLIAQEQVVPDTAYTAKITVSKEASPNIFRDSTTKDTSAAGLKFTFPKADVAALAVPGYEVMNDGTTAIYLDTVIAGGNVTGTLTYYNDTTDATAGAYVFAVNNTLPLFNLTYGDTKVNFKLTYDTSVTNLAQIQVNVVDAQAVKSESFKFNVSLTGGNINQIAQGTNDPNGNDLVYTGTASSSKGDFEYEYQTEYGLKIDAPKTTLKTEKVLFTVPNEPQKFVVVLGKDATVQEQIAAGQTGAKSKVKIEAITVDGAKTASKVPITATVAVLDTEVADAKADNLLLFGGPSVNKLVKQLGGMYADANTYNGVGKLYFVQNAFGGSNAAVVVAGWDAENTRAAAYVLAHYDSYASSLAGKTEVTVNGKDVTSLTVA